MRCAACRHENPDRAKFCLECGARLSASCPQCATELPAGAKFCLECGHRVAAPAEAAASRAASPPSASGSPATPGLATRLAAYTPKHLAEKILKFRSALEGAPGRPIQEVASRLPDPALVASLLAWSRVQAVHEDLDRIRRA